MSDNKSKDKDGFFQSVNKFFKRVGNQDLIKLGGDNKINILNSPQNKEELKQKQEMQVFRQYLQTKNWNNKHTEYYEEYRRMDATFPIINAAMRIYGQEVCISGDSVISIPKGNFTIRDLYEENKKNNNQYLSVQSYDTTNNRISWSDCNGIVNNGFKDVYEVTVQRILYQGTEGLDKVKEAKFKCTDNHLIMTSDKRFKQLKDLNIGDTILGLAKNIDPSCSCTSNDIVTTIILNIEFKGQEEVFDLINVSNGHNFSLKLTDNFFVFVHNCNKDADGEVFKIFSDDREVKKALHQCFYDNLKLDSRSYLYVRSMLKFGNLFGFLETRRGVGVTDIINLPPDNIRIMLEPNADRLDQFKYNWYGYGGGSGTGGGLPFDPWEIVHWKIIEDIEHEPYGQCLKGDTRIALENGVKEIELIEKGELVWSFDTNTQKKVLSKVLDKVCSGKKICYRISTVRNFLEATAEHKILTYEDNKFIYKYVNDLEVGDNLIIDKNFQIKVNDISSKPSDNFILESIKSITEIGEYETYDIYVENENHNFYANGIIVHNSILRSIVDTWRRIVLMREALVIYRITRAPQRFLFKIDATGMDPDAASRYADEMRKSLQKKPLMNPITGELDTKFNPMPIHKDSIIPLLDGRSITIEELSKEYENGIANYVYSIDDKTHEPLPGKVIWCGKNYTANKLVKVNLDDDTYVITAPEHPFILKDGTHVNAIDLKAEMSLMPFYTKCDIRKKNEQIYNSKTSLFNFTIDFIKNDGLNLNLFEYYNKNKSRRDNKLCQVCGIQMNTPKVCSRNCYKELRRQKYRGDKLSFYKGKLTTKCLYDKCDKFFEKYASSKTHKFCSNECKIKNRIGKRKEKITICIKNCESCNKNIKIYRKSKLNKRFCDNICRLKWFSTNFVGENSPHFIDDNNLNHKHKRVYGRNAKWSKLCAIIREKFDFKCLECGIHEQKTGVKMSVHHLISPRFFENYLDANHEDNLITLCRSCHSQCPEHKAMHRIIKENSFVLIKPDESEEIIKNYSERALMLYSERCEAVLFENGEFEDDEPIYLNHKINSIEIIENCAADVYCMTVEGDNGEQNRHNFAVCSLNEGSTFSRNGIYVSNSIQDDFYMPTYEGDSSDISVLEGASNLDAVEDYKIIKDDLFAGLLIPKSYLTFEEDLCLSLITNVLCLNGTYKSLKELIEDFNNGIVNYVYSSDEKGDITVGEIEWAGETKTVTEIYKIELDNGEIVECSDNHPWRMRDGSYVRADELNVGDSLMPLYTRISENGYEEFLHNNKQEWTSIDSLISKHKLNSKQIDFCIDKIEVNGSYYNHKIKSIQKVKLETPQILGDLRIKDHHNFALSAGVFVHNSNKAALCLRHDTIVRTNEGNITIKELASAFEKDNSKKVYVLSCNEFGLFTDGKVNWCKSTKKVDVLYRIHLSNGKYHDVTDNHPFLLESMIYRRADELKLGDLIKNLFEIEIYVTKVDILHLDIPEFVYDLEVEEYHNFALESGIFVHNCIHADTEIALVDGRHVRVEDLSKETKENWAYTYDKKDNKIIDAKIKWCKKTRQNAELVKIILDNGKHIISTPDHEFILEGGKEVEAQLLKVYDILQGSIYFSLTKYVVVSIEFLEERADTYDLEVENENHNFLTTAGVFIKNSQEDLRFNNAVKQYQSHYIEGLLHVALVHLYMNGYGKDELESFTIEMNGSSTLAEKTKNELLQQKIDLAKSILDSSSNGISLMSYTQVLKEVLKFTDEEIAKTFSDQLIENKLIWRLNQIKENGFYEDPDPDRKKAKLIGLDKDIDVFKNLQFESVLQLPKVESILSKKIEDEIKYLTAGTKKSASKKTIDEVIGLHESRIRNNIRRTYTDLGMKKYED